MWNRKEALFLSSVSRYLGLSIVFTSDLEYFASVVICGLHWYSHGVRGVGESKITIEFVASAAVLLWCESQSATRRSLSEWKP